MLWSYIRIRKINKMIANLPLHLPWPDPALVRLVEELWGFHQAYPLKFLKNARSWAENLLPLAPKFERALDIFLVHVTSQMQDDTKVTPSTEMAFELFYGLFASRANNPACEVLLKNLERTDNPDIWFYLLSLIEEWSSRDQSLYLPTKRQFDRLSGMFFNLSFSHDQHLIYYIMAEIWSLEKKENDSFSGDEFKNRLIKEVNTLIESASELYEKEDFEEVLEVLTDSLAE